jgi:hypothetical protein
MKTLSFIVALALLAAGAGPAAAQEAKGKAPAQENAKARILNALRLPQAAEKARAAGIGQEDVREVMNTARRNHVPAEDVETVLNQGAQESEQSGPPDNFGGMVKGLIEQGLRGPELAKKIHEEQIAQGKNRGQAMKEGGPGALREKGTARQNAGGEGQAQEQARTGSKTNEQAQSSKGSDRSDAAKSKSGSDSRPSGGKGGQ